MKHAHFRHLAVALITLAVSASGWAIERNGFRLDGAAVPVDEILPGGPPRNGIPAIDRPRFVPAARAGHVKPEDRVLGVVRGKTARAYPIAILNWHEVVNDRFGDEAIVVTFCPLCGTGMAFAARVAGRDLSFGVSGLLYNSDVLLYDRQTESLWSQIMAQAVTGPMRGQRLTFLPTAHTTWAEWRARHPATEVLSEETGYGRDYARDPYAGYRDSPDLIFPVATQDKRLHPKEQVIGLALGGEHKAYPFSALARVGRRAVEDRVGGQAIRVEFDPEARTGRVLDADGRELPSVIAFWFAWLAFHPQTALYEGK
ncbi:DUF3179 domain-containing protein [Aromatoleum bremense]|uniref:DUF3179 domain-containing protein n=1 Tax=Aromatoleum bremense TaxID=76115 RepID=A0ABX1NW08_9RHOO|nr:DUF3179 domain-containing protein [Aromatoleum bremense]NMG16107.1 DUF3179 domain-containing protein [Aromatoleum bremense]QTQ30201.1 putative protein DUf3179 [Aromatoleum bremense]